jgi:hypothetical protein
LSTDWSPSGSRTLLDELKVADAALHDPRILGKDRSKVPAFAGDAALGRVLADMVTRNPARTLRWRQVGSIAPGNRADLLMLRGGAGRRRYAGHDTPYRHLIDAGAPDVRLVLVDGDAVAGDPDAVRAVEGGRAQLVRDPSGCIVKAVAFRTSGAAPQADGDLAAAERSLRDTLRALGGDGAQAGSGPAGPAATFSYLRKRWNGGRDAAMSDAAFRDTVLAPRYGRIGDRLNLERVELDPLLAQAPEITFEAAAGGRVRPRLASAGSRRCRAREGR